MTADNRVFSCSAALLLLIECAATISAPPMASAAPGNAQITVLYDAFGKVSTMQKDWGYSALVEYGGKRILFDTGNNPEILAQNAKAKGVDLTKLDFVVMSHRHGDHMGGLTYLLKVNPTVKIYAPKEGFGVYGADLPSSFYRKDSSLPPEQRYYDGGPPEIMRFGSAWPGANFQLGCSHPGVDKIVEAAGTINPRIRLIVGGFHLVVTSDPDIENIVTALRDRFKVEYVAPGHCTGEPAFTALKKAFGDRYLYAGLGTTLAPTASQK
jgi:7,8-dihydropterin-6-yl-methyl-4-(beta-D-ribofuranosyl)aminobenzene 5'-phosphate synthase